MSTLPINGDNVGSSLSRPELTQVSHTGKPDDPTSSNASAISGAVSTQLRDPISEVATRATSDRRQTLNSIASVAEDIREAIDILNTALAKSPTKAIISRDEQLNRFIVKIADERSGEVIREVPSEAVLKFARNLQELKGLLFDEVL